MSSRVISTPKPKTATTLEKACTARPGQAQVEYLLLVLAVAIALLALVGAVGAVIVNFYTSANFFG